MTVDEIAKKINGTIHGDGSIEITSLLPLDEATAGSMTFFYPKSKKDTPALVKIAEKTTASAMIVQYYREEFPTTQIVVSNPLGAILQLTSYFLNFQEIQTGIHPTAIIHPSAKVDPTAKIGAFCVINENVSLAAGVVLHPHVVIYKDASIGENSVIHSGATIREGVQLGVECFIQNGVVIGGDGFGYIPDGKIGHRRISHIGSVIVHDRVDIGANSTIDRGMLGSTKIGQNTKIDNLVMIGHNVQIGERGLLCAQVGISGSSVIGSDVTLAGQVGVADHVTIVDGVRAGGQTGIYTDVEEKMDVSGSPHRKYRQWQKEHAYLAKLSDMYFQLKKISKFLNLKEKD
jgi:UDP-3-O-[3-hydroxymyristoyl] glucosamine N-acyltransferase